MVATLNNLVRVRSQLAEGLMLYLQALKDYPEIETLPYLGARRLRDVYISPDVQKQTEDVLAAPVPWEDECPHIQRAVILGDSGAGKTLLLRMTASYLATQSLEQLACQRKEIEAIPIPVVLRLVDIASSGLHEAIDQSIQRLFSHLPDSPLAKIVIGHINVILATECCYLFLDALDEVNYCAILKEELKPVSQAACRIFITSRPSAYNHAYLPFASLDEYTLLQFSSQKYERFIHQWFDQNEPRSHSITRLIASNGDLNDLAFNPLLLTLICINGESHDLRSGRESLNDLYRQVTYDILQRGCDADWQVTDNHKVDELQYLIQAVAWKLFKWNPLNTSYIYSRFRNAVLDAQREFRVNDEPESAIQKLRKSGLIITLTKGQISFVHKSFRDYLAAEHLTGLNRPEEQITELFQINSSERRSDLDMESEYALDLPPLAAQFGVPQWERSRWEKFRSRFERVSWISGTEEIVNFLSRSEAGLHLVPLLSPAKDKPVGDHPGLDSGDTDSAVGSPEKGKLSDNDPDLDSEPPSRMRMIILVSFLILVASFVLYYNFVRSALPTHRIIETQQTIPRPQTPLTITQKAALLSQEQPSVTVLNRSEVALQIAFIPYTPSPYLPQQVKPGASRLITLTPGKFKVQAQSTAGTAAQDYFFAAGKSYELTYDAVSPATATFRFENEGAVPVHLSISGAASKTVDLSPGTSQEVKVPVGKYTITASARDAAPVQREIQLEEGTIKICRYDVKPASPANQAQPAASPLNRRLPLLPSPGGTDNAQPRNDK